MIWADELEFINRMGFRKIRPHSKGFELCCDYCNDRKRRAFILSTNSDYAVYYCHHCSISTSLKKVIEDRNPILFEEYVKAEKQQYRKKLAEGKLFNKKKPEKNAVHKYKPHDLKVFTMSPRSFIPASESQDCIDYAIKRKIPARVFKKLLYCVNPKLPCHEMLIFPFYFDDTRVYAFQGRSLKDKRFYNFNHNESYKVYNIFHVNLSATVYIVESIIDSFQIPNCIAMCGTSLSSIIEDMIPYKVYIFDNDVSTKDKKGIHQAIEYAKKKEKVLIWPNELNQFKDPNDLIVKNKWTHTQLFDMIKNNIHEGIDAVIKLKFKLKLKVRE